MKELVEYIAKSLVDSPDQVRIKQIEGAQSVIIELRVAPDDMGKIIGKQGRVAKAMRSLLKVAAAREGRRVILEIV
ncbi:MAG: KH domain-containing protein [Chloroflexi bacterium]|nr:KH domain-containing protein [Chloroflexota bacterium]